MFCMSHADEIREGMRENVASFMGGSMSFCIKKYAKYITACVCALLQTP